MTITTVRVAVPHSNVGRHAPFVSAGIPGTVVPNGAGERVELAAHARRVASSPHHTNHTETTP